ncbi:FUSC family protein [Tissierella creatinophila]|uniref:Fusaric acid resistance protein family protein n=1 Tax=Tissierella creatinophila DSM 6911 TaxID=1123403 RepID=A0A1U7M9B2_TISCR|nr:aromatic acid exporter family protein [Tissierella creatinophila]OLS03799.1 fusaric acid resistance protein family protein [Tissierella creatinophila DSM 6911]
MKFKKVGMRTVKTVIAVVLTLEISKILNINSPILAGIAAIMTMETSVSESFSTGKYRMYGTVFGAIIALIITWISPVNFVTTALGLFVILYISNMLKWQDAVRMAMIVFLVIIIDFEEGYRFTYALNRTLDTFIGVIVGTTINYFIRPPKIEIKMETIIDNMTTEVIENIKGMIWSDKKPQLDNLKKEINYIEENYETLKKDTKFKINTHQSLINYEYIFEMFQNIHSHFRVINLLDSGVYIDEENKELLETMFLEEIPKREDIEKEQIYIIYNYHLREILYELKSIEIMYNYKSEIA